MSKSVTDPSVEAEDTAYPVRLAEQCYSVARDVQAKKCSFAGLIGCCRDQLVDSLNRAGNELLRLSQGREAEQREAARVREVLQSPIRERIIEAMAVVTWGERGRDLVSAEHERSTKMFARSIRRHYLAMADAALAIIHEPLQAGAAPEPERT
jgi:hypothetical protein